MKRNGEIFWILALLVGLLIPASAQDAAADPGNLTGYRGRTGQTFAFRVTGTTSGTVWGTDIYTDDSVLGAAAVHAGILSPGQSGVVHVTILAGQGSYTGTVRNGVTTSNYGAWHGSYRFESAAAGKGAVQAPPVTTAAHPDPGNLTGYRDRVGQTFLFQVTGTTSGTVWGTDIYTDDSALAVAAVHAGILRPGQSGAVRVTIVPGQGSYTGTSRNGVTTSNYGAWHGSYRVERP